MRKKKSQKDFGKRTSREKLPILSPKAIPEHCRRRKAEGRTISVDVFSETELVVDITEHELVPLHEVMSADEKRDLLEK